MDWKNEFVPFLSKGLDLVHDGIDIPEGYFPVLTNLVSAREGSLTARPGLVKAFEYSLCEPIHSVLQVEVDGEVHTLVGGGGDIYWLQPESLFNATLPEPDPGVEPERPIVSGLSGEPLTWGLYRPDNSEYPSVYVGDANKNVRLQWENGAWVSESMGIDPPPHPIPPPKLSAASESTSKKILAWNDGDANLNENTWASLMPTVEAYIGSSKPSREGVPGTVSTLPVWNVRTPAAGEALSTASVWSIVLGAPLDLDRGYNKSSRIEGWMLLSDPQNISEVRFIFGLSTAPPADITVYPMPSDFYQHTIVVSDLQKASGDSTVTTITEITTSTTEWVPGEPDPAQYRYDYYGGDYSSGNRVDPDPTPPMVPIVRTQTSWSRAPLTGASWFPISMRRGDFVRFGLSEHLGWDKVSTIKVVLVPLTHGSVFGFYDFDIVAGFGLDSSQGVPYDWRYTYWNETQGVESNPSPEQPGPTHAVARRARIPLLPPADPQVTHFKLYRRGGVAGDYHLVRKIPIGSGDSKYAPYHAWPCGPIAGGLGMSLVGMPTRVSSEGTTVSHSLAPGDWVRMECSSSAVIDGNSHRVSSVGPVEVKLAGRNYFGKSAVGGVAKWAVYLDDAEDESIMLAQTLRVDLDPPIPTIHSRTNKLRWSEDLDAAHGWSSNGVYTYPRDGDGPFGGGVAVMVEASGSVVDTDAFFRKYFIQRDITLTASDGLYWISAYVKRKRGDGKVVFQGVGVETFQVDIGVPPAPDYRWQRYEFPISIPSTQGGAWLVGVGFEKPDDAVWLWGFQMEPSSIPTPYIRTTLTEETVKDVTPWRTPAPVIVGPYLGKWFFAMGDKAQPSTLWWSNPNQPDCWSPANYVEVGHPGDPLQTGVVYDGKVYLLTRERMYAIYPSLAGPYPFVPIPTNCQYGAWSRHSVCVGPAIWFLSGSGIMQTSGGEAVNITKRSPVRPLFEGIASNGYPPVDYSAGDHENRLFWCDPYLHFAYRGRVWSDPVGDYEYSWWLLSYHSVQDRWETSSFPAELGYPTYAFPERIRNQNAQGGSSTLLGWSDGTVYRQTEGESDYGFPIDCEFKTRSMTQGEYRYSKLYGDALLDMDGDGAEIVVTPSLDNGTVACEPSTITTLTGRSTYTVPIVSGAESLWDGGDGSVGRSVDLAAAWQSTGSTSPVVYYTDISWKAHSNDRTVWNSAYENDGGLQDQWVSGLYLDCDTNGAQKLIRVWVDGLLVHQQGIVAAGRKPVRLSFGPIRGTKLRFTSDAVPGRLWAHKWISQQEPVQLDNLATAWEDLQWGHQKLIKGVALELDVVSVPKTLRVAIDGDDANTVGDPIVIERLGRVIVQHPLPNVLADTVRIVPEDDGILGRVYGIKWIYDREPPSLGLWQTQESTFGQSAYVFIKDMMIGLRSWDAVDLEVETESGTDVYNISSTYGERRQTRVQVRSRKSKTHKFRLTSATPFRLYAPECVIHARPWGSQGEYSTYQLPFPGGE